MKQNNIYKMVAKLLILTYLMVAILYITNVRQENNLLEHGIILNELREENAELQGMLSTYREKESKERHCSLAVVECNDSSDEP